MSVPSRKTRASISTKRSALLSSSPNTTILSNPEPREKRWFPISPQPQTKPWFSDRSVAVSSCYWGPWTGAVDQHSSGVNPVLVVLSRSDPSVNYLQTDPHYTPEPPICNKTTLRLGRGIASGGLPASHRRRPLSFLAMPQGLPVESAGVS